MQCACAYHYHGHLNLMNKSEYELIDSVLNSLSENFYNTQLQYHAQYLSFCPRSSDKRRREA